MTTLKTSEILVQAKALIANPESWMQGAGSNDDKTCFCTLGAIAEVAGFSFAIWEIYSHPAVKFLNKAVEHELPPGHNVAAYNDNHSHSEVMEAFDKAITLAIQEEQKN